MQYSSIKALSASGSLALSFNKIVCAKYLLSVWHAEDPRNYLCFWSTISFLSALMHNWNDRWVDPGLFSCYSLFWDQGYNHITFEYQPQPACPSIRAASRWLCNGKIYTVFIFLFKRTLMNRYERPAKTDTWLSVRTWRLRLEVVPWLFSIPWCWLIRHRQHCWFNIIHRRQSSKSLWKSFGQSEFQTADCLMCATRNVCNTQCVRVNVVFRVFLL